MDQNLVDRVRRAMACPCCGRQRTTREQLAFATGKSLRTVSRFLNDVPVDSSTEDVMRAWLTANLSQPEETIGA